MSELSEEEKKAIDYCKYTIDLANRLDEVIINLRKEPVIKILNLIQNQQKEIERLEARKYMFNAETGEISQIPLNNNYISKDKIKAKIEELDKQEQDLQNSISDKEREEYSDASISWELMDIHARREVLKQLLDEVEIKDNKEIIKPLDPNEVYFKDGTELVYKLMYNKINELAMTVNKIMEEKK